MITIKYLALLGRFVIIFGFVRKVRRSIWLNVALITLGPLHYRQSVLGVRQLLEDIKINTNISLFTLSSPTFSHFLSAKKFHCSALLKTWWMLPLSNTKNRWLVAVPLVLEKNWIIRACRVELELVLIGKWGVQRSGWNNPYRPMVSRGSDQAIGNQLYSFVLSNHWEVARGIIFLRVGVGDAHVESPVELQIELVLGLQAPASHNQFCLYPILFSYWMLARIYLIFGTRLALEFLINFTEF